MANITSTSKARGLKRGQKPKPKSGVQAARKRDRWDLTQFYNQPLPMIDPVTDRQQSKIGDGYHYPLGAFREIIDRDAHVNTCLDQRKNEVLRKEKLIRPGRGDKVKAEEARSLVETVLFKRLTLHGKDGGFEQDLNDLLSAIPMGLAISEIVWENDRFGLPKGDSGLGEVRDWYVPVGIESRDPRMFEFDKDGDMLFIPFDNPNGEATHRDKYIIFRPYTWYQDPYGYPRLRSIWWFTWFKRLIEKYYMSFLERFGSPIPIATPDLDYGLSDDDRTGLISAFSSFQQQTGLVVPPGVKVVFESINTGSINHYREILNYFNQQISMVLLGQTMTTDLGDSGGNKAATEVHERVLHGMQAMDARALESIINSTVIPAIVKPNLGPDFPMPELEIVTDPPTDLFKTAEMIEKVIAFGAHIPEKIIPDMFGLPTA